MDQPIETPRLREAVQFRHTGVNVASPTQVTRLLQQMGIRPTRRLGQNFLVDRNILRILLRTVQVSPGDVILEIGPGLGVVTAALAEVAGRVIAVEKDRRLGEYLRAHFAGVDTVEILVGDVLDVDVAQLLARGVTKVVSNLPYAAASRIMVELSRAQSPPPQMALTLQREVAQRVTAAPGRRQYGLLSVWLQAFYNTQCVKTVNRTCFWPVPRVASEIVLFERHDRIRMKPEVAETFFGLTRAAFQHRRKQMAGLLATLPQSLRVERSRCERLLEEVGICAQARPEDLAAEQWYRLALIIRDKIGA